jgi:hypothetical protein
MKPWLTLLLVAASAVVHAQPSPVNAPVQLSSRAGASLDSTLAELNSRGFRIVYSSALVTPRMTLRAAPRATRLEALLEEILSPWQLRAVPAANGDWLIVAAPPVPVSSVAVPESTPPVDELQSVDVTASRYGLATPGTSAVFLDRRGVEQMPHLGDDAVRMLKVLPGVSGGDFSAALNVRGGRRDEVQLRIDGAEIHNGFHFRDLDGALSVLDTNLVESIDFVTGGMTAREGDYMSGIVDMRTRRPRPDDEFRSAAGISFVGAYARTGRSFADGRGAWMASVRRGYLDVLMEQVQDEDEQLTPRFTDLFASLFYDFGDDTTVSAHMLLGDDDLRLLSLDEDEVDSAGTGRSAHVWATLDHRFSDLLEAKTVLSTATVRQRRDSEGEDEQRRGEVDADFRFRFSDLRSDWTWRFTERHMLLFGAAAGHTTADYDYTLTGYLVNPVAPGGREAIDRAFVGELDGSKHALHAAWRGRLASDLVIEAGARWDQYRYPDGLSFSVTSPRLNAVLGIGERGELRVAWGVMHQPQGVHELQVEDGVTQFFEPERAQQAVLGYAHHFEGGWSARMDVYRKDYSRLRDRFENVLDAMQLIPEGSLDRIRIEAPEAEATGVELSVRREAERGFAGWASLTLAKVEDDIVNYRRVPRLWDQRESLSFGLSWTGAKWNFNLAGLYHGGTPITDISLGSVTLPGGQAVPVIVAGELNAERVGDYARLDLRASRSVPLRRGRFSYYLEVTNLLNRENPCCLEAYHLNTDGTRTWLYQEQSNWLPMLPSFGFQFEF